VERAGETVSTLDLVGRGRFTLLTGVSGGSWAEAAARASAETGVEVRAIQIGPGCEVADTFGDWAMQSDVSPMRAAFSSGRTAMSAGGRADAVARNRRRS
jgi:hypothetical protein